MNKHSRKHEQGFIIFLIPIIIIVVLVVIFSSGNKDTAKKNDTNTSTPTEAPKSKETANESDAEQYCQDAALLGKYIDMNKISVIDAFNYNVQYQDGDSYDQQGYPVKFLQWNGKNKDTDKPTKFSCWISGPKDKITLHWLSVDGEDLYGSSGFQTYDKDGKLEQ